MRAAMSAGCRPHFAALAVATLVAGPHHNKLEGAVTTFIQEIGLDYLQIVFLIYLRTAPLPLGITVLFWGPLLFMQRSIWIQAAACFAQEAPYLRGFCHKNPETTSLLIRLPKQWALQFSSLHGLQTLLP